MTETAHALAARLRAAGASEATVASVLRLTAHARHWARVEATLAAALAEAGADWPGVPERDPRLPRAATGCQPLAHAWAILRLDLGGVGGREDAQGRATARMPWAEGLGSGRWHAGDGEAYRAAAREAAWILNQELTRIPKVHGQAWGPLLRLEVSPDGLVVVRPPDSEEPLDRGTRAEWTIPLDRLEPRWVRAEAIWRLVADSTAPGWAALASAAEREALTRWIVSQLDRWLTILDGPELAGPGIAAALLGAPRWAGVPACGLPGALADGALELDSIHSVSDVAPGQPSPGRSESWRQDWDYTVRRALATEQVATPARS